MPFSLNVDLTVTPAAGGAFRCQGTVSEQEDEVGTNPAAAMAEWLGRIDPAELEGAALQASEDYSAPMTAVILEVLRRWAGGS